MRWVWVDRFVAFERGKSARSVKNLSLAEDHFADHFPGYPVMPATLMLEGLAQTGGILVGEVNNFQEKVVLAKITKAQFHREAFAGEQLTYEAEILTFRPEGASVAGKVFASNPAAQAKAGTTGPGELIGEAEIFFAHLDKSRSQQMFGDHNFVFSGELKSLLGLAQLLATQPKDTGAPV